MDAAHAGPLSQIRVSRCLGAEHWNTRRDADSPEIQAISVPAGLDGGIPLCLAFCMMDAGVFQALELGIGQVQSGAEPVRESCSTRAVIGVRTLTDPASIVEHGEQSDDSNVGTGLRREPGTVLEDATPVGDAVDPRDSQLVAGKDLNQDVSRNQGSSCCGSYQIQGTDVPSIRGLLR